jgi:predicted glycogen debranching enzyme
VPPAGRVVLVNGFEAWLERPGETFALTSQCYTPDVIHPDGAQRIEAFDADPWPSWVFTMPDGSRIEHGVLVQPGRAATTLYWRLRGERGGTLAVRPLISGRDYHALHHENPAFRFDADVTGGRVVFRPYPGLPAIVVCSNGTYTHQPDWYRNFLYSEERARGLDHVEDLASPGVFRWDLTHRGGVDARRGGT